jgi:hypothetical protein
MALAETASREVTTVRKSMAVVVVSVASVCGALAGTASADSSNAGCQAYGAFVASAVQGNVPGGAVVSGIATSGPGAAPAFVEMFKQMTC